MFKKMEIIASFFLSMLPGAALGFLITLCHIKRHGGKEDDKNLIGNCLIFFGAVPTGLFVYTLYKLLIGNTHYSSAALSFGIFSGMVGMYIYLNKTIISKVK